MIFIKPIFNDNKLIDYNKLCLGVLNKSGQKIVCYNWFDYIFNSEEEDWLCLVNIHMYDNECDPHLTRIKLTNQKTFETKKIKFCRDHYLKRYKIKYKCMNHTKQKITERHNCSHSKTPGYIPIYTDCQSCSEKSKIN